MDHVWNLIITIKYAFKVRITNYRGDTEFKYGFIVGEQEIEQLSMFPMLPVYVFDYSEIQLHYPLSLEIISS